MPGGSAASSALGYRLMTLSGVSGPDAGFALATAGLGSAVVLNLIFWIALLVSIPLRGVNPLYVTAALVGLGIMVVVALLVLGLQHGQGRAERFLRWLGGKLRFDPDAAARALRHGRRAARGADRRPLAAAPGRCCGPASTGCSTRRRCGCSSAPSAARSTSTPCSSRSAWPTSSPSIPITPGGLGIVEGIYIPTLVGFGVRRRAATLGVASYRIAQFWLPILLGGLTVCLAARRTVVDRAARPPRPPARHRPPGDVGERAAHRVRPAPVGAQAAGRAAARRHRGPAGRARRGRHGCPRGARRACGRTRRERH